jgi:hypothetical protein
VLQPDGSPAPGEHFGRAPFYPVFLAGMTRLTRTSPALSAAPEPTGEPGADTATPPAGPGTGLLRAIRVVQSCLGGVLVWLVAWLANRAAGPAAATAAGALAALYPPLAWTPAILARRCSPLALGCAACDLGQPARGCRSGGRLAGLAVLTLWPALILLHGCPWLCWRQRWPAALFTLVRARHRPLDPGNARDKATVLVASKAALPWTGNHR